MAKIKGIVNDTGRTCTACGEFKLWEEFHNSKKGFNGKRIKCKECVKKYREDNHDTFVSYQKQYRYDNTDALAAYQKQYYKKYYTNNKDRLLEYNKQWREENKEILAEYQKMYRNSPATYENYKDQLTPLESPRESKEGYLEVKCATCEKYFTPTNQQVQPRVRVLKGTLSGENRLYCSDACKESCSVFNKIKYPKGFKKVSNREYQPEFRNMILERDNYACQVCGEIFDKKQLQAHHLTPVVCSPMEQVDIDNGICVCKECHINLHLTQEGITYAELIKAGKGIEDKE